MARALRVEYKNATYHIVARGYRGRAIFRDDEDRDDFLRRLGLACEKQGWSVFAYVLMDDQYHLVVNTPKPNLVEEMQWLQATYTRYFCLRHGQSGNVFGDRYKSVPIEYGPFRGRKKRAREDFLATLIDYLHLAPVRAKQVSEKRGENLFDYPWSSLATGYAAPRSKRPRWLDIAPRLAADQWADTAAGRRAYRRELESRMREEKVGEAGLPTELLEHQGKGISPQRGWYWGSAEFKRWLESKMRSPKTRRPRPPQRRTPKRVPRDKALSEARAREIMERGREWFGIPKREALSRPGRRGDLSRVAMAWAIWRHARMPQAWIAEKLGLRSSSNVCQRIRSFEAMEGKDLPGEVRRWRREWKPKKPRGKQA